MPKLLVDSDDEDGQKDVQLKINENYATAYERWRRKEEYQKLKDKYGEQILSEDSVASDGDDDESDEGDEDDTDDEDETLFDEQFIKVYTALKTKDPIIYDSKVSFFAEKKADDAKDEKQDQIGKELSIEKPKKMNLLKYHLDLVRKEKGLTEEDRLMESGGGPAYPNQNTETYVKEMEAIKNTFASFLENNDDDDDEFFTGLKSVPEKAAKPKMAASVIDLITTEAAIGEEKDENDDEEKEDDDDEEKEDDDDDEKMQGDEDEEMTEVADRLAQVAEQTATTSYHFQETNADVIKRYPRSVDSVRNIKGSTARNLKRSEVKERKMREKKEALQRFRELRRAEVKAKLAKLKEISGNNRLLEQLDPDIDLIVDDVTNFDPEKYDQCMAKLFDETYYDVSGQSESMKKPKFDYIPGIDDVDDNLNPINQKEGEGADDDDDKDQQQKEKAGDDDDGEGSRSLSKKQRKKLQKLQQKKNKKSEKSPAEKKNIGIYEDVIAGEVPTRFKYRQVPANDFGLTPEELLFADDKELNRWVSLKKTCQYRPMEEETYDIKVYGKKANDMTLKKKILKTLYDSPEQEEEKKDEDEDGDGDGDGGGGGDEDGVGDEEDDNANADEPSAHQIVEPKQKKKKNKKLPQQNIQQQSKPQKPQQQEQQQEQTEQRPGKRKRSRRNRPSNNGKGIDLTAERLKSYDLPHRVIKRLR